ncbi:MAG: hypothetical protein ACFFCQ_08410 [Promethearchaeota archaeon]
MPRKLANPKERGKVINKILTSIGTFSLLIWLLTTFLEVETNYFIIIGAISLITTILSRVYTRRSIDVTIGGGVIGFLFVWIIAWYFYDKKEETLQILEREFLVEDILIFFLFLCIIIWFMIPENTPVQELIFGLSPLLSAIILNIWKLGVLLLLLTWFSEFEFITPAAKVFFFILAFFDLWLLFTKQMKYDYADLILDPLKLLSTILAGPLQAIKWTLLTIIFIVLDLLILDWITGALLVLATFFGITTLSTSLTRTIINSGIIDSTIEEGKVIAPIVFEEIRELEIDDFKQVYQVQKSFKIRKEREIISFRPGEKILYVPFSPTLEESVGVFLARYEIIKDNISESEFIEKAQREVEEKETIYFRSIDTPFSMKHRDNYYHTKTRIHRIPKDQWRRIQDHLTPVDLYEFAKEIGFENREELDNAIQKGIQGTIEVQEQIRSRLRGVPAPTKQESYEVEIQNGLLRLPKELQEIKKMEESQEIEIIPGKGEFLFYARLKQKRE